MKGSDFFKHARHTKLEKKEKKKGYECARGRCVRRESLLQNCLPVKFKDPKFKHEIFMRIDMKYSGVEIIIEQFVVFQKLIHVYA